jgi:hypothetical protein
MNDQGFPATDVPTARLTIVGHCGVSAGLASDGLLTTAAKVQPPHLLLAGISTSMTK